MCAPPLWVKSSWKAPAPTCPHICWGNASKPVMFWFPFRATIYFPLFRGYALVFLLSGELQSEALLFPVHCDWPGTHSMPAHESPGATHLDDSAAENHRAPTAPMTQCTTAGGPQAPAWEWAGCPSTAEHLPSQLTGSLQGELNQPLAITT